MILNAFIAAASVAAGLYALQILDAPVSQITAGAFGLLTCYVLTLPPAAVRKTNVRPSGVRVPSWTPVLEPDHRIDGPAAIYGSREQRTASPTQSKKDGPSIRCPFCAITLTGVSHTIECSAAAS